MFHMLKVCVCVFLRGGGGGGDSPFHRKMQEKIYRKTSSNLSCCSGRGVARGRISRS